MQTLLQFLASAFLVFARQPCNPRDYDYGSVACVCNADYCDTIPEVLKLPEGTFLRYSTNKEGLRFLSDLGYFNAEIINNKHCNNKLVINRNETFQTINGFGGAFTDSTGINIKSLPENVQENLMNSYFSLDGIEYSLCRVPLAATDFSTHAYSYDDGDEDPELKYFALADEDFQYKIPYMQWALNLTNDNLKFFGSAWTAPKWMKTTNNYTGFFGLIKENMYQSWASYHLKFLQHYEEQGLRFWGITTGNEPFNAFIPFSPINNVGWLPQNANTYFSKYLGPTIRNSDQAHVKIMALDDQRIFLPWLMNWELKDEARQFIDGIAVHWYANGLADASLLTNTHDQFPEKFLLSTEASQGGLPEKLWSPVVQLGNWERGEKYSNDIMENLQNWGSGWIDWNMVLDLEGGPTYISNHLDAAIIVNVTGEEFYKNPMFYHIGHFSKFIPRDSVRIWTSKIDEDIPVVAFKRPDEAVAVVILNKKDKDVTITVLDYERGSTEITITQKSITSFVYW